MGGWHRAGSRVLEYFLCGRYATLGLVPCRGAGSNQVSTMNEQENTARILREEPTLVTGFWCRFGLHSWTKWDDPREEGLYHIQWRSCRHCNLAGYKKKYML